MTRRRPPITATVGLAWLLESSKGVAGVAIQRTAPVLLSMVMSSARPQAYARAGAVLEAMAGKVYRLGDRAGAGSKVKIINQLLAGVHIAAAAEAMALGLRAGVDAAALYEVITHSAGNSWMFENRMAHVLAATTRRCRRSTSSSRTWAWCSTRRAPASSRCRWPPPRTRCSCRRRPRAIAQRGRQRGDQDLPRHRAAGTAGGLRTCHEACCSAASPTTSPAPPTWPTTWCAPACAWCR